MRCSCSSRRRRPERASCSAISAAAPAPFEVIGARGHVRARVSCPADRAGDQRALGAALLLARAAGDRARAVAGCCEKRWASAASSAFPPRRTSSSAWWRRRSSCGPYLARVSRGELFAIMVGGMASIAGTVLFLYAASSGPCCPTRWRTCSSPPSFRRRRRSRSRSSWCRRAGEATGGDDRAALGGVGQHGCDHARHAGRRAAPRSTSSPCWWSSSRWSRSSTCDRALQPAGPLGWSLAPLAWLVRHPVERGAGGAARCSARRP